MLNIQVAAQPIIWSNDDFHDLGGGTPLQTCLREMREAGYTGTELGHKFPKDVTKLTMILKEYNLQLVSGWHSTYLSTRNLREETQDYKAHLDFLQKMGSPVVIVAECSHRVYNEAGRALSWDTNTFSEMGWTKIIAGLEEFALMANDRGMKLVYHHHMGTGVQSLEHIDRLMESTEHTWLLGDTGHLAFAGENPVEVFEKYKNRIGHVHLKNIRPEIVRRARFDQWSFDKAVREGVFTVPGDGGLNFAEIFDVLDSVDYKGWVVVEAEQDPAKANPLEYARKGRKHIHALTGV